MLHVPWPVNICQHNAPRQLNWALTLCKALWLSRFFTGYGEICSVESQAIGGSASGVGLGAFQKGDHPDGRCRMLKGLKGSREMERVSRCHKGSMSLLHFVGCIKIWTFHGCFVWVSWNEPLPEILDSSIYIYMYSNVYFMYFYTFLLALLVSEDDACCWEAARDSERSEPWPYDPRRRVCGARRMLEGPHDVSMKGQLYIYIYIL